MSNKKITLSDIASEIGVSVSTVSRILKQHPSQVKSRQEKKIFKIAHSLGYQKKSNLNNSKKTWRICFPHYDTFSQRLSSIIKKNFDKYGQAELIFTDLLYDGFDSINFDGVIYKSHPRANKLKNIPVVRVLGPVGEPCEHDLVTYNNSLVGKLAADKLIEQGCKEFIWVAGFDNFLAKERFFGFQNAIKTIIPKATIHEVVNFTSDVAELLKKIKKSENKKIGIFAVNDEVAHSFYSGLMGLGIMTHLKDFVLIGCDNRPESLKLYDIKPYTIDLRLDKIGKIAVEKIVNRKPYSIYNPNTYEPETILVTPKLITP